jgi:hypothetical protein
MIFLANLFNKGKSEQTRKEKLNVSSNTPISEFVAIKTIQLRFRLMKRREIVKKYIGQVHNPFKNSKSPENLQKEMLSMEKQKNGEAFLRIFGVEKKYARPFFCAYLIASHADFLFGGSQKTKLESVLEETAIPLMNELESFLKCQNNQSIENSLRMFLRIYFDTFSNWKNQDEPKLIEALISGYLDQMELLYSVGKKTKLGTYPGNNEREGVMKEWLPHVQKHQDTIRKKLRQVGGKKALDKLSKRIEEFKDQKEQEESEAQKKEYLDTKDEKTNPIIKLENIEIVHELFLNPNFSFKELTSPIAEDRPFNLTFEKIMALDSKEKLELVLLLKDSLMAICPEKEFPTIKETLEEEFVKEQIFGGSFEWPKFLDYILDLMSRYCAPFRDEMIAKLKKDPSCEAIIKTLLEMKEDLSNANLMMLRKSLLTDPGILVGYEQNWFIEEKISYENARKWINKEKLEFSQQEEKSPKDYNNNTSIIQFLFIGLLFTDASVEGETLCLDIKRINKWRKEIGQIIEKCTIEVLKDKTDNIVTDNPVKNLFAKRLKDNILSRLNASKNQTRAEDFLNSLKKQGFEPAISDVCALLQELVIFFDFHIKVHGNTYDELLKL